MNKGSHFPFPLQPSPTLKSALVGPASEERRGKTSPPFLDRGQRGANERESELGTDRRGGVGNELLGNASPSLGRTAGPGILIDSWHVIVFEYSSELLLI